MDVLFAAQQAGGLALLGTATLLGVRHGIDWDHIAAIADIASTTTNAERAEEDHDLADAGSVTAAKQARRSFGKLELHALWLSSLYALGHALVVALLGMAALYFEAILPDWIDPIMERVVGLTLVVLGAWVFYSLYQYWRGEADFRLQSRWMLVFAGVRHAWRKFRTSAHGHHHEEAFHIDQYGPRTAFGIGLVHGIGAETGSQVLIIAAVGGAASQGLGGLMMVAFIVGLLISNTAIAMFTATGFISSSRAKSVYVVVGVLAGLFSLVIGAYFLLGIGDQLPDVQEIINAIFGTIEA
jgi:cytochrome c biogenesis protein CcdA